MRAPVGRPYEPGADEGPSMTYPQAWKRLPSPPPPSPPPAPPASVAPDVRNHSQALRRCISALFVVLSIALAFAVGYALR